MFKKGDLVECIALEGNTWISIGRKYEVLGLDNGYIKILNNEGMLDIPYHPMLFKKVSESIEDKRKELEDAVKVLYKYKCACCFPSTPIINIKDNSEESIQKFLDKVLGVVKTPAQIEAEEIAEQMKKLEERLKELSKSL